MALDPKLIEAVDRAIKVARRNRPQRIPTVGIAGAQGSGKTTLAKGYGEATGLKVAHFSLDDCYKSRMDRKRMSLREHPLFATRGVPGTHDIYLLPSTIDWLGKLDEDGCAPLPSFDKLADEPIRASARPIFFGRPDVILVEGWCLGAIPQYDEDLRDPCNELEATEDADGVWRRKANEYLEEYQLAFSSLTAMLFLRAPSFDVVHGWRCQQEEGLLGRPLVEEDRARIGRFIQHFERITRHMLEAHSPRYRSGGVRAHVVADLAEDRSVLAVRGHEHIL